nr:MAG TPA: hypothetical protein [Caudoviricetes sp.]
MNLKTAFLYAASAAFLVITGLAVYCAVITAVTDISSAQKLYAVSAGTFVVSAFLKGAAK